MIAPSQVRRMADHGPDLWALVDALATLVDALTKIYIGG